jgi:hypothetical protein
MSEGEGDVEAARGTLSQAEDLFLQGLPYGSRWVESGLLVAMAGLHERLTDPVVALTTFDRSSLQTINPFTTGLIRERGRLAALTGDTARAIREYRHYLTLRYDPEPELAAEVEEVRRALAELTGS